MPVGLRFRTSGSYDSFIQQAASFSRIIACDIQRASRWSEKSAFHLLSQPFMQRVRSVRIEHPIWLQRPALQHALFALPCLSSLELVVYEEYKLLESAVAQATGLSSVTIWVMLHQRVPNLQAIQSCRSITSLSLVKEMSEFAFDSLPAILPSFLAHLRLQRFFDVETMPRDVIGAVFARLPLLCELTIHKGIIRAILRGLFEAGVAALPLLRRVSFAWMRR